jgi:hypothetical protein
MCRAADNLEDGPSGETKTLQREGRRWRAALAFDELWNREGMTDLHRARLTACAGQGPGASALLADPSALQGRVQSADLYRATVRRFLGIPPPSLTWLLHCGACGQAFGTDSADARAAHLAGCNAALQSDSGRSVLSYHFVHAALKAAVRKIFHESGIFDDVDVETVGGPDT